MASNRIYPLFVMTLCHSCTQEQRPDSRNTLDLSRPVVNEENAGRHCLVSVSPPHVFPRWKASLQPRWHLILGLAVNARVDLDWCACRCGCDPGSVLRRSLLFALETIMLNPWGISLDWFERFGIRVSSCVRPEGFYVFIDLFVVIVSLYHRQSELCSLNVIG